MDRRPEQTESRPSSFEHHARRVLQFLRQRYRLDRWLVARVHRDDWILLLVDDPSGELRRGMVLPWQDSICRRKLTQGEGLVPDVSADPEARSAPIAVRLQIGAYLGAPLTAPDGRLIGTLCGISRDARPELGPPDRELLAVLADLLAGFLAQEFHAIELERQGERFRFESMTDALTHLPNRSAWEDKLGEERGRAQRLGETNFVTLVELGAPESADGSRDQSRQSSDDLLRRSAVTLRYAVRDTDFVARLAGDAFGILGIQSGTVEEAEVDGRIRSALKRRGIEALVATAAGGPAEDPAELWQRADRALVRDKRRRETRAESDGKAPIA